MSRSHGLLSPAACRASEGSTAGRAALLLLPRLSPAALQRAAVILSGASNACQPASKAVETGIQRCLKLWGAVVSKLLSNKRQLSEINHTNPFFFQQRLIIQKEGHIQSMRHGAAKWLAQCGCECSKTSSASPQSEDSDQFLRGESTGPVSRGREMDFHFTA